MNPRPPVRQVTLNLTDDDMTVLKKQSTRKKEKNKSQLERVMTVITVIIFLILMLAITATILIALFKLIAFLIAL